MKTHISSTKRIFEHLIFGPDHKLQELTTKNFNNKTLTDKDKKEKTTTQNVTKEKAKHSKKN